MKLAVYTLGYVVGVPLLVGVFCAGVASWAVVR